MEDRTRLGVRSRCTGSEASSSPLSVAEEVEEDVEPEEAESDVELEVEDESFTDEDEQEEVEEEPGDEEEETETPIKNQHAKKSAFEDDEDNSLRLRKKPVLEVQQRRGENWDNS